MRAVVWHGKNDVRVDEVDDPRIEAPTDAVIRVTATAISGTDLHLYTRLWPVMEEGDLLGHEAVGEVIEVGREVVDIAPGDRVVVPANVACGWCLQCQDRMYSQCETAQMTPVRLGAQAEFVRVPHAQFGPLKVPDDGADLRHVLLAELLPTAWQAVEFASLRPGDTVSVHGLGPVGQMAARIALHRGAGRVIGVDQVPERLDMAARHGVETIDFSEVKDATEAIADLTRGSLCHAAIDAVGMEASGSLRDSLLQVTKVQPDKLAALHSALGAVRRGGTLSIAGVYGGPFPMFPLGDLFDKQITVRMGQANVRRWFDDLLPLVTADDDPLGVDDLVTHRMPIEQAPYAYEIFQKKMDGCVKVVLEP
ncbi:MAG TPA: alcohol dehydrogenase catalytic domain-containing protein [Acidimicrobiales bacterium]